MKDPETAEVWQTAFGKDFCGMAQGDDKTGQKGTNSVFVMTHKEIDVAMKAGHKWTYACIIVNYKPQKANPNLIHIAVSRNLVTYSGNTYMRTADLTTSKLLCGTVSSAPTEHDTCASISKNSISWRP